VVQYPVEPCRAAHRDDFGWSWHNTHVSVCTAGISEIRISGVAGNGTFVSCPGSVIIFPKGRGTTNIHHAGGLQSVVIEIDASRLERLFHGEARSIDSRITPQLCIDDPHTSRPSFAT
jgi:hypothetical protein